MVTIEDKLDIFYKLVYQDAEENTKKALEDMEEQNELKLEVKIEELEKAKQQSINRRKAFAEVQKNEAISKAMGNKRHKLLIKREELLEDLIKSIKMRAVEFTKTIEYKEYLLEEVKHALTPLDEKEIIIKLKNEDRERYQNDMIQIAKGVGKKLYFDSLDIGEIGGFIIIDKDKTYSLNNTFKTVINENRYKIGKELYIALEKTGDSNE